MYNKLLFRSLFVGVYFLALAACSDDDKEIAPGAPECVFNSETGEYKVKIKKEVALTAHVTNATSPLYAWKQDEKLYPTIPFTILKERHWENIL